MQEPSDGGAPSALLEFSGPIAIVGGGAVEPAILREVAERGVVLIGADGGGDVIRAAGLTPATIIGDLDSLSDRASWGAETVLREIPEQITTDFEKCIYSTRAPVTIALGMTGKRFDHTMAALHVVTRYAANRAIILVDEHDIALGVSGAFSFTATKGERISMHPLQPVDFAASTGLVYALDGLTFAPGILTGVSNAGLGGLFTATPAAGQDGVWLLILDKYRLWDLVAHLETKKAGAMPA